MYYFGGSSHTWFKVLHGLENEFRCIAIDLWGFGDSQAPARQLSVNDNAKTVAELISAFQLKDLY